MSVPCPAGFACLGLEIAAALNDTVSAIPCTAGLLCQSGYDVRFCPQGTFCPSPTQSVECPSGHYCPNSATKASECDVMGICGTGSAYQLSPITMVVLLLILLILYIIRKCGLARAVRAAKEAAAQHQFELKRQNTHALIRLPTGGHRVAQITQKIVMSFDDVSVAVKLPSGKKRTILRNVTGQFENGRLIAVMGPSGSGKTTFLHVLAQRVRITGGRLSVNGLTEVNKLSQVTGFVPQGDEMLSMLTVRDVLMHSALTRLPSDWSHAEKIEHVTYVLDVLNLKRIADSVVGDGVRRGISGGERRRLNIGCELVSDPFFLMLDEPTSGLDAASSLEVMQALSAVKERGIMVVCVIHQPRQEIFNSFDDLMLLAAGGLPVYCGPANLAISYFEQFGFHTINAVNPADYLIDVVSGRVPCALDLAALLEKDDITDKKKQRIVDLLRTPSSLPSPKALVNPHGPLAEVEEEEEDEDEEEDHAPLGEGRDTQETWENASSAYGRNYRDHSNETSQSRRTHDYTWEAESTFSGSDVRVRNRLFGNQTGQKDSPPMVPPIPLASLSRAVVPTSAEPSHIEAHGLGSGRSDSLATDQKEARPTSSRRPELPTLNLLHDNLMQAALFDESGRHPDNAPHQHAEVTVFSEDNEEPTMMDDDPEHSVAFSDATASNAPVVARKMRLATDGGPGVLEDINVPSQIPQSPRRSPRSYVESSGSPALAALLKADGRRRNSRGGEPSLPIPLTQSVLESLAHMTHHNAVHPYSEPDDEDGDGTGEGQQQPVAHPADQLDDRHQQRLLEDDLSPRSDVNRPEYSVNSRANLDLVAGMYGPISTGPRSIDVMSHSSRANLDQLAGLYSHLAPASVAGSDVGSQFSSTAPFGSTNHPSNTAGHPQGRNPVRGFATTEQISPRGFMSKNSIQELHEYEDEYAERSQSATPPLSPKEDRQRRNSDSAVSAPAPDTTADFGSKDSLTSSSAAQSQVSPDGPVFRPALRVEVSSNGVAGTLSTSSVKDGVAPYQQPHPPGMSTITVSLEREFSAPYFQRALSNVSNPTIALMPSSTSDNDMHPQSYTPEDTKKLLKLANRKAPSGFILCYRYFIRCALMDWREPTQVLFASVVQFVAGLALATSRFGYERYFPPLPMAIARTCPPIIRDRCDFEAADDRVISLMMSFLSFAVPAVSAGMAAPAFGKYRAVFFRERETGLSLIPYYFGRVLYDLITILWFSLCLVAPFYTLSPTGLPYFPHLLAIIYSLTFVGFASGYAISLSVRYELAAMTGVMSNIFLSVFNGLHPPLATVQTWTYASWIWDLSYTRWGFSALVNLSTRGQFTGELEDRRVEVMSRQGLDASWHGFWTACAYICAAGALLRVVAFGLLYNRRRLTS